MRDEKEKCACCWWAAKRSPMDLKERGAKDKPYECVFLAGFLGTESQEIFRAEADFCSSYVYKAKEGEKNGAV